MDLLSTAWGHYWTVGPWLAHRLSPTKTPPEADFCATLRDPRVGPVRITGRIRHTPSSDFALIVIHGLGGETGSHYMALAGNAAERAGVACLRLNLRGADRSGDDYYHAGLTADLRAAIGSPELARYARIGVLGYSLGGHLALRYAAEGAHERVSAVAAICPPLDLDKGAAAIDRPDKWPYRIQLLWALHEVYAACAGRRESRVSAAEARQIGTVREWDRRIVAPRFGFDSAEHYYAEVSVGPRLGDIEVRTLLVEAEADPMIPAGTLRLSIARASSAVDVRWIARGGHVGFPGTLDLGAAAPLGLEAQVIGWMLGR